MSRAIVWLLGLWCDQGELAVVDLAGSLQVLETGERECVRG